MPQLQEPERAVVAAITGSLGDPAQVRAYLDELARLVESAGGQVVGEVLQSRPEPDPATYLGAGKVTELAAQVRERNASLVVVAEEISPGQAARLEDAVGVRVVDRTQVILDIFAQRARSREGKIQVELAQLLYLLPRLRGKGEALSRLGGGIGTRGPGESKLEVDRRHLRRRIAHLRRELAAVQQERDVWRAARKDLPHVALVGYTNAGKTSLLQRLTGREDQGADDRLFATLDPAVRRLRLPKGRRVLLVDTVGFVRRLPHTLVAAFRATLEEVVHAAALVHVVDASSPELEEHMEAVDKVLGELGARDKPTLVVLNKMDRVGEEALARLPKGPRVLPVSCVTGEGLWRVTAELERMLADRRVRVQVLVPFAEGALLSLMYETGQVREIRHGPEGTYVDALLDPAVAARVMERLGGPLPASAPY